MRYSVLSSFHMFDIFHSHVWGATGMEPSRAAPASLRQPLAPVSTSSARPAAPRPQGWARAPPEVARGGRRGLRRLLGQHPGLKKRTSDGGQACPSATAAGAGRLPGRSLQPSGPRAADARPRRRGEGTVAARGQTAAGPRATHPDAGNAGPRPSGTRAVASFLPPPPGSEPRWPRRTGLPGSKRGAGSGGGRRLAQAPGGLPSARAAASARA